MPEPVATDLYTIEDAEDHIGDLRGDAAILGEALTQDDTDLTPNTPTAGSIQYSASGHQRYVSSDGSTYYTGRGTYPATGALSLTTTLTDVPGLIASLGVGAYRVSAQILIAPGGAGGALHYRVHAAGGLTVSNGRAAVTELFQANGVNVADFDVIDTTFNGGSPGGTTSRLGIFEGYFVVTVAGTLSIQASQSATANTTIRQYGSYLEVFPAPST